MSKQLAAYEQERMRRFKSTKSAIIKEKNYPNVQCRLYRSFPQSLGAIIKTHFLRRSTVYLILQQAECFRCIGPVPQFASLSFRPLELTYFSDNGANRGHLPLHYCCMFSFPSSSSSSSSS
jgi:hypothetical protein